MEFKLDMCLIAMSLWAKFESKGLLRLPNIALKHFFVYFSHLSKRYHGNNNGQIDVKLAVDMRPMATCLCQISETYFEL